MEFVRASRPPIGKQKHFYIDPLAAHAVLWAPLRICFIYGPGFSWQITFTAGRAAVYAQPF
jgi:hypothetical protein